MAQHHHNQYNRTQGLFTAASASLYNSGGKHYADEEELDGEVDEPPDHPMKFIKTINGSTHGSGSSSSSSANSEPAQSISPRYRKASLLTQALTSPELTPLSENEAPVLTSDGGITSPARTNTPSPPLPAISNPSLKPLESKDLFDEKHGKDHINLRQEPGLERTQEVKVEEELGRRRCISFACSQKRPSQVAEEKINGVRVPPTRPLPTTSVAPKRPCLLRFACPTKPSRSGSEESINTQQAARPLQESTSSQAILKAPDHPPVPMSDPIPIVREHLEDICKQDVGGVSNDATPSVFPPTVNNQDRRLQFNRVDFQKSEATRFHEFAGSFADEGEWANEQTAFRQKITINDTLRKENAIRRLAEEAEEEARNEDEDLYGNADDELDQSFDDGNETDDEEGFADSDVESDAGSTYQFWTPGITTAATSADHMDQIRLVSQRTVSESSIESVLGGNRQRDESSPKHSRMTKKASRHRKDSDTHPPELPDSSDFVVGTIDEDRPFEEEYLTRMKQKEQSKKKIIPQDIDPSFPTSDLEAEGDDDDDEPEDQNDSEEKAATTTENDACETLGIQYSRDEDSSAGGQSPSGAKRILHSPSPRRLHSPPPSRRLFAQTAHHLRSPPPTHRKLVSPPSSRRPSLSGSPSRTRGINMARLAQRPNLTHTASLPRMPNPFWKMHRASEYRETNTPSPGTSPKTAYQIIQDSHRRGPIEIVQGLANRRQRRKEKFWRQQCSRAHAGKERERRCQPGKGAQRMREVGLEMADRFKGYKQDTKLVLSV